MPPEDYLDIDGLRNFDAVARGADWGERPPSRFLSVWFQCCHTYGRMYRNRHGTRYEGRCPRCGTAVGAKIGPQGTSQRVFRAQ